jgi:hypothetical protein
VTEAHPGDWRVAEDGRMAVEDWVLCQLRTTATIPTITTTTKYYYYYYYYYRIACMLASALALPNVWWHQLNFGHIMLNPLENS